MCPQLRTHASTKVPCYWCRLNNSPNDVTPLRHTPNALNCTMPIIWGNYLYVSIFLNQQWCEQSKLCPQIFNCCSQLGETSMLVHIRFRKNSWPENSFDSFISKMCCHEKQCCESGPVFSDPDSRIRFWKFVCGSGSYLDIPNSFWANKICLPFFTWFKNLVRLKIKDENFFAETVF